MAAITCIISASDFSGYAFRTIEATSQMKITIFDGLMMCPLSTIISLLSYFWYPSIA